MSEKVDITMVKKGSPLEVEFITDPDDPHFTSILQRKAKTGELTASHYILSSDREQWQQLYEKQGFVTNDAHNDTRGYNTRAYGGESNT